MSDGLRLVRLSIIGSVALLPLLILPSMVGVLIDYAHFSASAAGQVAAVGFAGNALGALAIGLRIRHLDPRALAVWGAAALVIFDAASALVLDLPIWVFLAFRAISGLGGAAAFAAVMATIAASPAPERGYGVFMVFQFGLSAVGLYLLPQVLPAIEANGFYLVLAAAGVVAFLQTGAIVRRQGAQEAATIELQMLLKPAALLAMLGIGLFEAANLMHFTYAERIGLGFGYNEHRVGEILGVATLLGMPAAFAVAWLGDRYGQLLPLMAALVVASAALGLLIVSDGGASYVLAMCAVSVAWGFGLPYFQAVEARLDPGGSVVVAGGFFTSVGSALGPSLAGLLVAPTGYGAVLMGAIAIYVVVAVLMFLSNSLAGR